MKKIKQSKFSIFNCPITNLKSEHEITLLTAAVFIKNEFQEQTLLLRNLKDAYERGAFKKIKFLYITTSGSFTERNDKALIKHSGFICIDWDNLTAEQLIKARSFIIADTAHTLLCFISPSGTGLKIIYAIDPDKFSQKEWYTAYTKYLSDLCNIPGAKIDSSCSNVSRACFLPHDPEIFINPKFYSEDPEEEIEIIDAAKYLNSSNESFELYNRKSGISGQLMKMVRLAKPNFENKNAESNFRYLVFLQSKRNKEYGINAREPWIQQLTCLCNQFGMEEATTQKFILNYFEKHSESLRPAKPIDVKTYLIAPVKDTYLRYKNEFDTWENYNEEPEETPVIPAAIYENLPPILSQICNLFNNGRPKDVVFLSSLIVLSSDFKSVTGLYRHGIRLGSNLNAFIAAPASAGKGVMMFARILGNPFHESLKEDYKKECEEYEELLKEYQEGSDDGEVKKPPRKPILKKFFIPADSSSIAVKECMNANQNYGVIVDSEADVLSQTRKNDWGNYDSIIKKAFQHEDIELMRKTDGQYIHIKRSHLSVLLSGTPNQIKRLILSIEDGFFSRFLFYSFPFKPVWEDVFEEANNNIVNQLERISVKVFNFSKRLDELYASRKLDLIDEPLLFKLSNTQRQTFNEHMEIQQKMIYELYGDDVAANVRRMGVIAFRLMMLFSIIRLIDEPGDIPKVIVCKDIDYDTVFKMTDCLLLHTISVYNFLKKTGKTSNSKNSKFSFLESLPNEFKRDQYLMYASYLEIKEKTAEHYIEQLIQGEFIKRVTQNHYVKL